MSPGTLPFVLDLLLMTVLAVPTCAFLWRRRDAPGAKMLTVIVAIGGMRALTYAGVIASPDLASKLAFYDVFETPTILSASLLLVFAAQYTGNTAWLTRSVLAVLAGVPALTIALIWTNPLHQLIWTERVLDPGAGLTQLSVDRTPTTALLGVFGLVVSLAGIGLLAHAVLSAPQLFRGQTALVLTALAIPVAGNTLNLLNAPPIGNTRVSVFLLPIGSALLAVGLYRYRLFDLAPVAYRAVIAGMADGVLLVDASDRVVDLNPAAAALIGVPGASAVGRPAPTLLPAPLLAALAGAPGEEVAIEAGGAERYLDVLSSPLRVAGSVVGRVVVLRDATDRRLRRENARLAVQLERQVAELEESRRRVTAAEERLRREIAELLHTRVQGRLLLAGHRLGELLDELEPGGPAHQLVTQARAELEEVREREVRAASHLLHPTVIRMGLSAAVEALADRYEEQGLPITVAVDDALAARDRPRDGLPEELRLGAYRIVEEALANVVRHAGASRVDVVLSLDAFAERLRVVVRDDGRGFDAERAAPGLGLASIGARVEQLGGDWTVASQPGAGTTLAVDLPLPVGSSGSDPVGAPSAFTGVAASATDRTVPA